MASLQAHIAVWIIPWRVKRCMKDCRDHRLARQILRPAPYRVPETMRITKTEVDGIPGEWVESQGSAQSVLLYLHGGGYFGCSAETHHPSPHGLPCTVSVSSRLTTASPPSISRLRWTTLTRKLCTEEHTSELQSHSDLVCRLLLEKKKRPQEYM